MHSIKRILVANRGEIAVRILRTARSLGYRTIAVYSDADAGAPHVAAADHALHIGASPAADSYLNIERILAAARASDADAVHPGYGFLSENPQFARACEDAGLVFIGPGADAMELMGNKAQAKRRMIETGVPCVPGYEGADQADDVLAEEAAKIGYPVMVKASAGGGGRGMRLVESEKHLTDALRTARSEAENAFGCGDLILEMAVVRPRHVEIQVFADNHGNVIHLGERDCSVQRRHQKIVEEAPCPVMTNDLRARMGAAAVEAARSIGYRGAGTVEFLLDGEGGFYFLEMNTRLQVEHPVTELVTGLDLVALQFRVAEGEPLGLAQEDVALSGHAMEVRLYAEDPAQDFLPCTGTVGTWRPSERDGIRTDSGIELGSVVSPFYDPMIAKVIAHGPTRNAARNRLIEALRETIVFGLQTNIRFLIDVLQEPAFARGEVTTAFVSEMSGSGDLASAGPDFEDAAGCAVLNFELDRDAAASRAIDVPPELHGWSSNGGLTTPYHFTSNDIEYRLDVKPVGQAQYVVGNDDQMVEIEVRRSADGGTTMTVGGQSKPAFAAMTQAGILDANINGYSFRLQNLGGLSALDGLEAGGGHVRAPMHGRVVEVFVKEGDTVDAGSRLLVLEAMKMQHEITTDVGGRIIQIACKPEDQVGADDLLVEIELTDD